MTKIDRLLHELTLDEKITLLAGVDLWRTAAVPRLGIPSLKMTDGPNGARGAWGDLSPSAALFPVGAALGATWNTELIEQAGGALAADTKSKDAQLLLGPTVNIHRTPVAGRNFECFSEDPYLTGKIAAAYIRGLQGGGVGACIKHFACNDQEFERMSISAEVDERTLREIYLEPFRRALEEASPWSLMSSYNRVNGTYASENADLLKQVLKEEWGFDGLVISDWKGTYSDNVPANGLDLEMPGPARHMRPQAVHQALADGRLTLEELDDKVRRLLRLIDRTIGLAWRKPQVERAEDTPARRQFLRSLAQETVVLLKNEGGLLPLNAARVRKIAVIGELARWPNVMGGGSSRVGPHYVVSPLEGIRERAGGSVDVVFAQGCEVHRHALPLEPAALTGEDGRRGGLTLQLYDNLQLTGKPAFETLTPHSSFDWWGPGVPAVNQSRFSARLAGSYRAEQAGEHTFSLSSIGASRMLIDGRVLIDNWDDYEEGTEKTEAVSIAAGQAVKLEVHYRWDREAYWRLLRLGCRPPRAEDPIAEAVKAASEADLAIVVAGLTSDWESEGYDRASMRLPGRQDELIERVAAANAHTLVVLNSGSPVTMPWEPQVPAILQQWYNGQECGHALADLVFGDVSPSGRLPTTFPRRYEDNPAANHYPGSNGQVHYEEGVFVGYRHYDSNGIEPLFPFGHGLSYAAFQYGNIWLSREAIGEAEALEVSVDVHNAATCAAREVIQLYVHPVNATVRRPEQELKGFVKTQLQPGETRTVRFELHRDAFWHYDPEAHAWKVEPGEFEIRVGHSSRDLPLRARVRVLPGAAAQAGPRGSEAARSARTT